MLDLKFSFLLLFALSLIAFSCSDDIEDGQMAFEESVYFPGNLDNSAASTGEVIHEGKMVTGCTGWTYSLGHSYGCSLAHRSLSYVQQRIVEIDAQRTGDCSDYFEGMLDGWVDCNAPSGDGGSNQQGDPPDCYWDNRGRYICH